MMRAHAREGTIGAMTSAHTELLAYRFPPEARFEGQLVGALERLEAGGALRVLDVLMVRRDPDTGDLEAVEVRSTGAGGLVAPLIDFRLDPSRRARATQRALARDGGARVQALGSQLGAGEVMAVALVEHVWAEALEDAVTRIGGTRVPSPELTAGPQP
jgi:hypothetical protein